MVMERKTPETTPGRTAGTILGDTFINELGHRLVWVKYAEGIRVERIDDLLKLGLFIETPADE